MTTRQVSRVVACFATAALIVPAAAEAPINVATNLDSLAEWVEERVADGVYPGAGIIVGSGDQVLLERYVGSYRADTQVQIASAGKWLAAATIAALVDEGAIQWDDPADKWVPDMTGPMARATLRQLLAHTAGYPAYQATDRPEDYYATLAESVAHIVPLPANAAPGKHFRYEGL